jgi:drug/metabolite transporter (DMT)-like permease
VIGLLNALAQYLVIRAFMLAPASLLAPFSYSTIVWATLIGALVFGTYPDAMSLAGTMILVGAGLYVWHRERTLTTPTTAPGASISEIAKIPEDPGDDSERDEQR